MSTPFEVVSTERLTYSLNEAEISENGLQRLTVNRSPSLALQRASEHDTEFQLLPVTEYEIEQGTEAEILLPYLCMDQDLSVNPSEPNFSFSTTLLDELANQTYVGIYRYDKYLNERVVPELYTNGDSFVWYEGTLTEAEVIMALFSHVEVDSSSLNITPQGFYSITHAHLLPGFAQWPIWAAVHDQDASEFLNGYNDIRREYSNLPPVTADSIQFLFDLNHFVFHFAGMDEQKNRFTGLPETSLLPVLNLEPYAFIQYEPDLIDQQNQDTGIQFNAEHSFDTDGSITSFQWMIEDQALAGASISMQFVRETGGGSLTPIVLTVTDDAGATSTDTVFVPYTNRLPDSIEDTDEQPTGFQITASYPSPVSENATVLFDLFEPRDLEINIYDMLGREIRKLDQRLFWQGQHKVIWDTRDNRGVEVPPGVYYIQIRSQIERHIEQLVVVR